MADAPTPERPAPTNAAAKPKLFFQLSRAQQRKHGKSAPVLRQLEGDTLSDKLVTYRKTIRFHVKAGHDDVVQLVHDIHKGLQDPNARDEKGRNALHFACHEGAESAVLALIKEDCSVDEPDMEMRWTPMHYAVMGKFKHIAAILLKYAPTPYVTINRRDKIGTTPLMLAAGEGYPSIVRLLLDNGADIDDRDVRELHMTFSLENHALIEWLPFVDAERRYDGTTLWYVRDPM
ncbi:hypothetical protein H310_06681, partial [Aphanomyces invadans]